MQLRTELLEPHKADRRHRFLQVFSYVFSMYLCFYCGSKNVFQKLHSLHRS